MKTIENRPFERICIKDLTISVIPPYEGDLNLVGIKNIKDVLNSEGAKAISEIEAVAEAEGALIKTRLEEGDVHKKIVEVAAEEDCDLIIIGNNRRNGVRKLFNGNIVEKVINHAPCPVLVVRT